MILPHEAISAGLVAEIELTSVRLHTQLRSLVTAKLVDPLLCMSASCDVADEWTGSQKMLARLNVHKCEGLRWRTWRRIDGRLLKAI